MLFLIEEGKRGDKMEKEVMAKVCTNCFDTYSEKKNKCPKCNSKGYFWTIIGTDHYSIKKGGEIALIVR